MTKRILISAATSGIGSAIAERLAETHALLLHGRDSAKLEALRERLPNAAAHAVFVANLAEMDFSDMRERLAEEIAREGEISGFVHCAGTDFFETARNYDDARTRELFSVNLFSAMAFVSALLKKRVNGKTLEDVLFISSVSSVRGCAGKSFYASSKGALNAYARSLARELAPRVRVNSLLCGAILTPMTEALFRDAGARERAEASQPLGVGVPADVAGLAAFLFSEAARFVTGAEIPADGGFCI
ncbi:MAG: SDR family NAD(P)-dependent oxidoreductase [Candidatus Spyradosoma sp.]